MRSNKFIYAFFITFIYALLTFSAGATAQVNEMEQEELCKASIRGASLADLNNLFSSDLVEQCRKGPMNDDLSVQILILAIGEPVFYILEMGQALGLFTHSLSLSDPMLNVLKPIHDVMGGFNWLMFYSLLFLMALMFLIQTVRWSRSEKETGLIKWLNRGFSQNAIAVALTVPVMGWMTPIQVVAGLLVVIIVFAGKWMVTLFFAGMFLADTAGNILSDVTPKIETSLVDTVMIYRCDILKRENLLNGIIAAENIKDRAGLEANAVYQCLQGPGETLTNTGNVAEEKIVYKVTLSPLNNYERCVEQHLDYLGSKSINPINDVDCGTVALNLPSAIKNPDPLKQSMGQLFLSEKTQGPLKKIALLIHEYSCRFRAISEENKLGNFTASCAKLSVSPDGYRYSWILDEIIDKEVIARYVNPLTDLSKKEMRDQVEQQKAAATNAVTEQQGQLISILRQAASELSQSGELPSNERDVNNLANKMDKGAWMIASVFLSKTAQNVEGKALTATIGDFYSASHSSMKMLLRVSFSTLDKTWLLTEDLEPLIGKAYFAQKIFTEEAGKHIQSKIVGIVLPNFGLYNDQLKCWQDQSLCEISALNPFISLGETGIDIFNHALVGWTATTVLSKLSNVSYRTTGIRTKLMAVTILGEFYVLYMMIGILLAIIIPLYPLLKIMSICTKWGLEVLKELLGLQLSMAFAPFSDPSQKLLTEDLRKALARLVALGMYFIFIIFGVLVMFMTFSFLFSLNVLLMGGLALVVQFDNGAHAVETLFMGVVFDVIVAMLLFLEVKACTDLIDQVPSALAERFSLELSQTEDIGEQIMRRFKNYVLPGVQKFMTKIR